MTKYSVINDVMITRSRRETTSQSCCVISIDNSGCSMRRKQCYYHPSIGLRQNAADDDDDDEDDDDDDDDDDDEDNEMVLA